MIRYLSIEQVIVLHDESIRQHGGAEGIRDRGLIESAVAQPSMTFGGEELYPTLIDKAAAFGYSLIANHAFVDGNKRVGLAALDVFLRVNGFVVRAGLEEFETAILAVAAGTMKRHAFAEWLHVHTVPLDDKATDHGT
jgi:death on curing protein